MAYIRRFIPCAPYEIKTFEAWLEELAQEEGLFLVSCRRAFAKFEKGTPKPMRYRVDADPDRCWDPSQERQQLYEEFGWQYIDNRSEHLVVYGTDDFSLPELHTDPALQIEACGKLQKKCLWKTLLLFCLFPLWLPLRIFAGNWLYWLRHSALITAFVLLLFFCFLDTMKEIRQLQKLKKQIVEETEVAETEDFHKAKRKLLLRTCYRITAEVFLFLFLLSPFWIKNWNEHIPLSAQNSAELPTLSPVAFGSHKNLSDSSYFSYYTSFLAPVQYEIFQFSDDFYLDTQYFQCQSEFLSESIGKTYLMTEADNNLNKTETQTLADGTKLEYRAKDFQNYLVIQKGSRILLLKSYTEIDLWENREKFLPLLDKTYSLPEES